MKKIAAPLRTELAQYRELSAFSQFGSELEAEARERLAQGRRIQEVFKQPQYRPLPAEYETIILYAAAGKYLLEIEPEKISSFEEELFKLVEEEYPEILQSLRQKKELEPEIEESLQQAINRCRIIFSQEQAKKAGGTR